MAGQRDDIADAMLINGVARMLHEWEQRTHEPSSLKPLRECVWFYWQSPRLPRPLIRGKYPTSWPWSAAARDAHHLQESRAELIVEHAVPISILLRSLVAAPREDIDVLVRELAAQIDCVIVTKDEDKLLRAAGLNHAMPQGWRHGDDLWARYRLAGLDTQGFAPLVDSP